MNPASVGQGGLEAVSQPGSASAPREMRYPSPASTMARDTTALEVRNRRRGLLEYPRL